MLHFDEMDGSQVVLGPITPASDAVGERQELSPAQLAACARAAAEELVGELERGSELSGGWADEAVGFALVQTAMDRCLGRLSRRGCWGRSNQAPSNEFWAAAGAWLSLGSLQERARSKPRGYAGDYEMFVQFFEGHCVAHPLGRLFDRYFQSQAAVEAVRTRTQQTAAAIVSHCVRADRPEPYTIVSVGCGPAIDIELAIRWLPPERRNSLAVALLDLDGDAVEHASQRLGKLLPEEQVVGRRDNLYRLAEKRAALALLDRADFLVCSGLFDYLPDEPAQRMLRAFWERLSECGALLVGNFAPHNPTRAYMEWIGNWYLTYRTPEQLLQLAEQAGIPPNAATVGAERLGIDLFLAAEKLG